jgi:hypothetical protein
LSFEVTGFDDKSASDRFTSGNSSRIAIMASTPLISGHARAKPQVVVDRPERELPDG